MSLFRSWIANDQLNRNYHRLSLKPAANTATGRVVIAHPMFPPSLNPPTQSTSSRLARSATSLPRHMTMTTSAISHFYMLEVDYPSHTPETGLSIGCSYLGEVKMLDNICDESDIKRNTSNHFDDFNRDRSSSCQRQCFSYLGSHHPLS